MIEVHRFVTNESEDEERGVKRIKCSKNDLIEKCLIKLMCELKGKFNLHYHSLLLMDYLIFDQKVK